ncbi:MAG: phage holin family protein [Propioniciclava sp.]|uniref:phage holin family protein n=1 Tax=Propioniciclava sp. TaxID=2038686 RepID=UPI0039E2EE89
MAEPQIADVINDITADVKTIVRGEIELAKAELVPQVKRLGIGVGFFAVAAFAAIIAGLLLFICGGLAFSALYINAVPVVWAFTLGFLTMAVVLLIIAGVFVLIGKGRMKVSAPEATIGEANLTAAAVTAAIAQGQADVRAVVAGTRPGRP